MTSSTGRDRNVGFTGVAGAGKTHAAARLVASRPLVIWLDPAGTTRLHDRAFNVRTVEAARAIFATYRNAHVVVGVDHLSRAELIAEVDAAVQLGIDDPRKVTVVIDEFKLVSKNGRTTETLDKALRAGRHHGVSVWPITQRALDLRPDIRSGMDEVWFFRCIDNSDIRFIRDIDKPLAETVRRLPDRKAAVLNTSTGEWSIKTAP